MQNSRAGHDTKSQLDRKVPLQRPPNGETLDQVPRFITNPADILILQRAIGNQTVQRLLRADAEELETGAAIIEPTHLRRNFSQISLHRMLAHELTHIVQKQTGSVPMGAVQRAPGNDKSPGSPPSVQFGDDGPIPAENQKMVQIALDLAYRTAASPLFAAKVGDLKRSMGKSIPGLANLSQQKYLTALSQMVIHLADTSKNTHVKKAIQEEGILAGGLPIAGFTPIGGNNVYLRRFALKEGRDALASLILHESFHVAGVPPKPIDQIREYIMEAAAHGFEASVGLPMSQIAAEAANIHSVRERGQGLAFTVSVTKPDVIPANTIMIEIFDGNRQKVFSWEVANKNFTRIFGWHGLDASDKPTESGMHSIRVVAGNTLYAEYDYMLTRAKK